MNAALSEKQPSECDGWKVFFLVTRLRTLQVYSFVRFPSNIHQSRVNVHPENELHHLASK